MAAAPRSDRHHPDWVLRALRAIFPVNDRLIDGAGVTTDPEVTAKVVASRLEPFADGPRTTIVRIEPTLLS